MKKILASLALLVALASPASAFEISDIGGKTQTLSFVADTQIPGPNQSQLALCHLNEHITVFGYNLTDTIVSYALSEDKCETNDYLRLFSEDQMITAQSLSLIDADLPTEAKTSFEQQVRNYGLWGAIGLFFAYVVLSRLLSLLGVWNHDGNTRVKAATKILSAMCHAAKCDGHVATKEINLIIATAERLTGHTYAAADVMRMADKADLNLSVHGYIDFGKGLKDREKELMLRSVLYVIVADGRMLPAEYEFATELAHGLGMPAADFRRMLNIALEDLDTVQATL